MLINARCFSELITIITDVERLYQLESPFIYFSFIIESLK